MNGEDAPIEGELIKKGIPQTEADLITDAESTAVGALSLTKQAGLEVIGPSLTEIKGFAKTIEKHRKDAKAPILEQGKMIDKAYSIALDPLKKAENHLKSLYGEIQRDEEEKRRKEAEAEAARIAKNAEKRAERREAKGNVEEAEQVRREAEMEAEAAKAAISTAPIEKQKGVSERKVWQWEIADMQAFIAAVAAGTDKRLRADMLQVNRAAINKMVKALEDGAGDIPGLKVFYTKSVSVRT